jgi:hypothetical protein
VGKATNVGRVMASVEEFNFRQSATKDVLVGLQKSDVALMSLHKYEIRVRASIVPSGMETCWP